MHKQIERWIDIYQTHYRKEVTEPEKQAIELALRDVPPDHLEQAFLSAMKQSRFFPTVADILGQVPSWGDPRPRPWYSVRFDEDLSPYVLLKGVKVQPELHACHAEVEKIRSLKKNGNGNKSQAITEARGWLALLNPYEALHVRCDFVPHPVCPNCAGVLEARANPVITCLMETYPNTTGGWNPMHKGFILCDPCSRAIKTALKID